MVSHRSPLRTLGAFVLAVAVAACADALGTSPSASSLAGVSSGRLADSTPPDTTPPDTTPPDTTPPDSGALAVINGVVIGVDSTVVPPQFGPVRRTHVTLFAITRIPDSSASTASLRFDSIATTLTDRAGRFVFTGLQPRVHGLRAIPPAASGLPPGTARARAVVAPDSSQVPITFIYLYKLPG